MKCEASQPVATEDNSSPAFAYFGTYCWIEIDEPDFSALRDTL
jgi:hypothetical protein